jgi:zinc transport system substrate-binding protein
MFIFFLAFFPFFITAQVPTRSHQVIVSIAPYQYFVEAIVQETATVILLVPSGASFHHFEPTPKQVWETAKGDLWFRIGESFETRALSALQEHHPHLQVVDLREGVDLITLDATSHSCCHANGADLHIWLSPRAVKGQVVRIGNALMATYPEHRERYQRRLDTLLANLEQLDSEIQLLLAPIHNRILMVGHPAYAYFARDYSFTQLPIEFEGRDPSSKQLEQILCQARAQKIKTIFTQPQYHYKPTQILAQELSATIVLLDPYAKEYFSNMRHIAQQIATHLQVKQ